MSRARWAVGRTARIFALPINAGFGRQSAMAIPARQRWIFYVLALAFTLVAMRFAGGQEHSATQSSVAGPQRADRPVRETTADVGRVDTLPSIRLELLSERSVPQPPAGDPFQSRSWEPPAPVVAPAPARPPRPETPPLPFTYLGKLVEDASTILFLAREDRNYVVRTGDTIEGTYRIEEIRDEAAVFIYLPLKSKQTLAFATGAAATAGDGAPSERRGSRRRRPDDDDDD
jgi:hypothetical protein